MKIDEASINHNALRLIKDTIIWELSADEKMHDVQLMTLGYIEGITEMAEALKEALKA